MRIISGSLRGRTLNAAPLSGVRPTASRTREAIFNILTHHKALHELALDGLPGAHVADICCGSGALGLEAISRGAASVTFVDQNAEVLRALAQTVEQWKIKDQCHLRRANATALPQATQPHSIIFLDPPYEQHSLPAIFKELHQKGWLAPNALVMAELSARHSLTPPPHYQILDQRQYGAAQIVLLHYMPD